MVDRGGAMILNPQKAFIGEFPLGKTLFYMAVFRKLHIEIYFKCELCRKCVYFFSWFVSKLDGVGPVDNRP